MGDKTRGIYHKFNVTRTDGSSEPGGKHHECFYFVLDVDHDPHAKAALKAYAKSCRTEYPKLAEDLDEMVAGCDFGTAVLGRAALHCNCSGTAPTMPTYRTEHLPTCPCSGLTKGAG